MTTPIVQIALARTAIDSIDTKIIELLGQRFAAAKKIGAAKKELGTAITDPTREQVIQALRQQNCLKYHVDQAFADELFGLIIKEAKRLQS